MPDRLHLDLSAGARGDMIAGALVALGAPLGAAREALRTLGLPSAELDLEATRRGGLVATALHLRIDGEELRAPLVPDEPGRLARGDRRERHRHAVPRPRRHEATRAPLVAVSTAAAVEGGGPAFVRDDDDAPRGRSRGARRGAPTLSPWERWLGGEPAGLRELIDLIKKSALSPVVKALAVKSARRLAEALTTVAGDDARVDGRTAVRMACDLVSVAALVDALSPAAVTASPVAVSRSGHDADGVIGAEGWPSPSPWLLEVLAGVPVLERDEAAPVSDVAGAAAAWACVSRFGARGVSSSTSQGLGASNADPPGRFVGVRALQGPPSPVPTRAGSAQIVPTILLEALVPRDTDRAALSRELVAVGVRRLVAAAVEDLLEPGSGAGSPVVAVSATVPVSSVDDATSVLWRAGALDVTAAWVEQRLAAVQDVTVPVGKGRKNQQAAKKQSVRVRVVTDGDEVVRVEPDLEECRDVARRLRVSLHTVAAEAVAAWEQLAPKGRTRKGRDDEG